MVKRVGEYEKFDVKIFKNISCLWLSEGLCWFHPKTTGFKNISCLWLSSKVKAEKSEKNRFKNISCLWLSHAFGLRLLRVY